MTRPLPNATRGTEALIAKHGVTGALSVVQNSLQLLRAYVIRSLTCPECYGSLIIRENRSPENYIWFSFQCCDCNREWLSFGVEIPGYDEEE